MAITNVLLRRILSISTTYSFQEFKGLHYHYMVTLISSLKVIKYHITQPGLELNNIFPGSL
jgi:hypothetical protein